MDGWANRLLADVGNWRPKDVGDPTGARVVPARTCLEAIELPELPKGWRPATTAHDGFPLEFGKPEALRYNRGGGMVWHSDRHRPAKDPGLVHLGTLVVARYDPHTEGGVLHVRQDRVDHGRQQYVADVDTILMRPGPGWSEALILRGQGHEVTAIAAGGRFVLKLPAYVRRRPRPADGYRGKWHPEWPAHAEVLRDADRQAELTSKSPDAKPEDVRAVWLAIFNSGIQRKRQAYFYTD